MSIFTLTVPAVVAAPPAKVWKAWTEPSALEAWYGLRDDWKTIVEELDVRPGGRYRIALTPPGRDTFTESGEYLEVVEPERLVYTMHMSGEDLHTTVTVTFRETDGGTDVVVTETGYPDAGARDRHQRGWIAFLERLALSLD